LAGLLRRALANGKHRDNRTHPENDSKHR
jgi:hypothetical protein